MLLFLSRGAFADFAEFWGLGFKVCVRLRTRTRPLISKEGPVPYYVRYKAEPHLPNK